MCTNKTGTKIKAINQMLVKWQTKLYGSILSKPYFVIRAERTYTENLIPSGKLYLSSLFNADMPI